MQFLSERAIYEIYKWAGRFLSLYSTELIDRRISTNSNSRWHEPSKLHENLLEVKLHENSWPRKLPERAPRPLVEWRNPIDTDQVPLLFVRSEDTRNLPSCSSESCRSSVWYVKSHKISRPTCVSRAQPSLPCKKPQKLTWLASSKTPISAPSTQRGSPLCPKTSNWHEESEESEHKSFTATKTAIFIATHLSKHTKKLADKIRPLFITS